MNAGGGFGVGKLMREQTYLYGIIQQYCFENLELIYEFLIFKMILLRMKNLGVDNFCPPVRVIQ